jgi:nitrogen fixation/metabolism regulation signal transduction histidine kinase
MRSGKGMKYENRLMLLVAVAGLPGAVVAGVLLWSGDYPPRVQWTLGALILVIWTAAAYSLRERVVRPLQTISNVLAGLCGEDYSVRARGGRGDDALGEVHRELNALADSLREQRLGAVEASALLRKVMEEIEVAVFAFDSSQRLRLVNRAGEKLLARPAESLIRRSAAELGLGDCLEGDAPRILQISFPGGSGRWGVRRGLFRQEGMPHQLLVLSDLSRALRQEELQAWQRLLRVLGHELNNSLAPIKSLAATLSSFFRKSPRPADWEDDMRRGLDIISTRADALSRFMEAYTRVAKLPPPRLGQVDVAQWVDRIVGLETRLRIEVAPGPALVIQADGDQLDQLLINLTRNAVDAALETGGGARVGWSKTASEIELRVEDDGPGLSNTANLFVPFFTTKPKGTGIGLALCQQIAEAHGGTVGLENRVGASGCVARVRLPLERGI